MPLLRLLLWLALTGVGVAHAQQQTTITGRLSGHDGQPMLKAHVRLSRIVARLQAPTLATTEVTKDGSFRLATTETGLLLLQFTGVNNQRMEVPVFVETPTLVKINVRFGITAQVRFADAGSTQAKFATIYAEIMARREAFLTAKAEYERAGKPMDEFSYPWGVAQANLSRQIAAEKNPVLRRALLFAYLDLSDGEYGASLDPKLAQAALAEIPPTSVLWSLNPDLISIAVAGSGQPEKYVDYVRQLISGHPDPQVAREVRAELSPDRKIMIGKPIPMFSLTSLDDPKIYYTNESLKGKVYLIDFWATWCAPCLGEMAHLHKLYEQYRTKGFEIVSVSLDAGPEAVNNFRKGRWKMPWLNSFAGMWPQQSAKGNARVLEELEVAGIPKAILVDSHGQIVAAGMELRGPRLDKTLTRVLGGVH